MLRTALLRAAGSFTLALATASGGTSAHAQRPAAAATFDHSAFDRLLRAHVANGLVDYDAFARDTAFDGYLHRLAAFDPAGLPRDEQVAFWINAYNAYTIRLIIQHHERTSIRNIDKTLGFVKADGPWKERLAVVGGVAYGLDDLEQGILRPRYHEPRIHVALVCAAMGCPPLRSEAYSGARLDDQLDDQARTFLLHSPTRNRVDVATQTVFLSPIFVEFHDYIRDFGGSEASVGRFVARYYPPGPARDLLLSGDFRVERTAYDWTLNSQANARRGTP
jgi:hypothetical protein